jgi:PAS domain S-box-containing protein
VQSDQQPVKILIVDDRPSNLLAMESLLQDMGLGLLTAASGEEALRQLLRHEVAMILLDVQMPGLDGYATAALIRQRERTRDTPIIFITASSPSETYIAHGYSLGAVDYIFRPIEPHILRSKVAVFAELYNKREQVRQQSERLRRANDELDQRVQERTADLARTNAALQAEIRVRQRAEEQRIQLLAREQHARLQAETAEARYRTLFEGTAEAILILNAEGRFVDANPAAIMMLGHSRDELLEMHGQDILAPYGDAPADAEFLGAYYWRGEFEARRKDGSTVAVEGQTTTVELPDGMVCVLGLRDISERRALQRMQQDFIAMVSHELQTPLTSLKGYAQFMQRRGTYNEKALTTILSQVTRLERLIGDLLALTRLESGRLELRRAPLDLVALVRTTTEQATQLSTQHRLVLEAPEGPLVGCWDLDRLTQILDNLLTNAIKYSPNGGEIRIQVEDHGSEAVVTVRDQGVGVSPDALPYLFQRFYRGSNTATNVKGLGLGLYITKALVDAHGGRITAASRVDEGTIIVFSLPYAPPEGETPSAAKLIGQAAEP